MPLFSSRPSVVTAFRGRKVAWERCVYNAGAVRIDGLTYVVYRALGEDGVSRLGLWTSMDGLIGLKRPAFPIFAPEKKWEMPVDAEGRRAAHRAQFGTVREVGGCEDPRLVHIGNYLYMTYTAHADIPRLAMARILVEDFVRAAGIARGYQDWAPLWERLGVVYAATENKNGYLLPEKFGGRFVLYHRISPDIQVAEFGRIKFPTWEMGTALLKPRPEMWDAEKIGGGAPALRTELGWVHFYHGVSAGERGPVYSLGLFVTSLDDPFTVVGRSSGPVLSPEQPCEREGWVNDVVFTCGAVPAARDSRETMTADDRVIIYYGAADEVVCAASGVLGELVDEFSAFT